MFWQGYRTAHGTTAASTVTADSENSDDSDRDQGLALCHVTGSHWHGEPETLALLTTVTTSGRPRARPGGQVTTI